MMTNRLQPFLLAVLMSGAVSLGFSSQSLGEEHTEGTDEQVAEETDEQPAEEFYLHGFIEVGGLVFVDRPPVADRAKFEEYGETSPGFIIPEVYIEFGTADGLNFAEIRGTNLTENDRNVVVELSKPGSHYLTFGWDETPHLYSTSAVTLHSGPANNLVVDDAVQAALQPAAPAARETIVNANVRRTELSVDRNSGRAEFRFTPAPEWDIRLNYSHEKRDGTKPFRGNWGSPFFPGNIVEFPEPIDYTTQTIGASAQYLGKLSEGRTWTANLAYAGSFFENEFESVAWDIPFQDPADPLARGRHALAPDNYANAITLSGGIDLSKNTRFTGTVSYNMMRQDEDFIAGTINPGLLPGLSPLPATSLSGEIDTLTVDSKLTTKLHSDVQATAHYRYYSSDNDTPELTFLDYARADSGIVTTDRTNLASSYIKQNADLDFVWDAHDMVTLGLLLGWEQYDRDRRDVDVTNEYSAKVTADLEPADWLSMRASALYARRQFNNYNYDTFVGNVTYPGTGGPQADLMRKFDLSDRDRTKLNLSAEASLSDGLTITVLGGVQNDEFEDNFVGGEVGLLHDRSWDAGVELYYMADDAISFFASYTREEFDRRIRSNAWEEDVIDEVDTVTGGINWAIVPDMLDLRLDGTYSWATEKVATFPNVKNEYQRYDASLKYTFNEDQKRRFGWTGDAFATLGYAYERNELTDWGDLAVPYLQSDSSSIFLADQNPNYEAQIVYGTLKLQW
jgi:MtrB/PioB family decaheme-associated outer membrane protein